MTAALDMALDALAELDDMSQQEYSAAIIALIAAEIVCFWTMQRRPATPDALMEPLEQLGVMHDQATFYWAKAYTAAQLTANLADLKIPRQEPDYDA